MPFSADAWTRIDRSFIDADRVTHGGFSPKFFARLGISDGEVPANLRAHVAAGMQRALEATVLKMAGVGENLCLAGGLGFNALLVNALERSGQWRNVFVQPCAGNAGTALGAVFHAWHNVYGKTARLSIGNLCLGPSFTAEEIKQVLENCKLHFKYLLTGEELIDTAVAQLNEHRIIAWMHGRMEFGPRALGNRSILASPLDPYSTENLNAYIKHREGFRKFAASVPEELAAEYFELGPNARFLATVGRARRRIESGLRARFWRTIWCASTRFRARTIRCTGSCCMRRGSRPGCRCCITRRSICSAIRWFARLGMRCAVFIPRGSMRCSWGIF